MSHASSATVNGDELLAATIRTLTERYPSTMPLLSAQGLDLCCGGGHVLREALELHEIDSDTFLPALISVISASEGGS